jgi:hypothetical protein
MTPAKVGSPRSVETVGGATISASLESMEPSVAGDPFLDKRKAEIAKEKAAAAALPIVFPPHSVIFVCYRHRHDGAQHPLLASPQDAECHRLQDLWLQDARRKAGQYENFTSDGWDMILPAKFRAVPIFVVVPPE